MELSTWIQAAIGAVWLAFAVVLLRVRVHDGKLAPWLYVAIGFCLLRAFDFLTVRTGALDVAALVVVLDVLVLVTLIVLVVATERLRHGLAREHAGAERAQAEYSRALLDYTQLVRHRIANPLTAVIGGAQTLLELEVSEPTRRRLLEAMLDSARQLERVALHPERVSQEEFSLQPSPAPLHEPAALEALEQEAGGIEADFREANWQLLDALPDGHASAISFVCECSARECAQPVVMALSDYYEVHRAPQQFVTAPGHDVPAIEDVVRREPGWWVVRKRGPAARDARRRARRVPWRRAPRAADA